MLENPSDIIPETVPSITNIDDTKVVTRLTFSDVDAISDGSIQNAPKDIDRLEKISKERSEQRKLDSLLDEDDDNDDDAPLERIKIHMDENTPITLDDVFDLDNPPLNDVLELDGIEDL